MKLNSIKFSVLFFLFLAQSCEKSENSDDLQGVILGGNFPRWESTKIPLCWMNPEDSDPKTRLEFQAFVEEQMGRTGVVEVVGWQKCSPQMDPEHIEIRAALATTSQESGGGLSFVGKANGSLGLIPPISVSGEVLNFPKVLNNSEVQIDVGNATLVTFVTQSWPKNKLDQNWQKTAFLHEIGHAVGLLHEQDHNGSNCDLGVQRDPSNISLGNFDATSIMNYCFVSPAQEPKLSQGDIESIRALYTTGIFVTQETFFKQTDGQAGTLSQDAKCLLPEGTFLKLAGFLTGEKNLKIKLLEGIPGCSFKEGFIFRPHFDMAVHAVTQQATFLKGKNEEASKLTDLELCALPLGQELWITQKGLEEGSWRLLTPLSSACKLKGGFLEDGHLAKIFQPRAFE